MSKPLLIAHRGDTVNFSENTLEAFQSSFDKGAAGIELDVQFSKGELIVVHDYLFDQSKTYVTLSGVLENFANKGRLEIEIKAFDLDFLSPLQELLAQYGKADIEITTSVLPIVSYLHEKLPHITIGIIFNQMEFEIWMTDEFIRTKIIKMMKLCKAQRAHIPNMFIDKSIVDECHSEGFQVHGHIFKRSIEEQVSIYQKFQNLDVDQCTFDDIKLLCEVR